MKVEHLELENFRNYKKISLDFSDGLNYFVGKNAAGKTNLIESIYVLSIGKSFKAQSNVELINKDAKFCSICGTVKSNGKSKKIKVELIPDGKKIRINNDLIKKSSELISALNVLLFVPNDVSVLRDAPKVRRQYLNLNISKNDRSYLKKTINFEKILKERNECLKEVKVNKELIDVLTRQLIELSYDLFIARRQFIDKLNKEITNVYKEILGFSGNIRISYKTFIDSEVNYLSKAKKLYEDSYEEDLRKKTTTIGLQKDDFKVFLDEKDASLFCSQGESRMIAIALKISPYYLVNDEENKPVIILDDVLSELDEDHEERLLNYLKKLNQVFITNTEKLACDGCSFYKCENDVVTKEQ